MADGIYQSVICFFVAYLLFAPAVAVTESGLGVGDTERIGVFVATSTVFVVNSYILLNTYRWDWLMLLLVGISIMLVWFWTGVYTSFPKAAGVSFYEAAAEVYGLLTFWTAFLLTVPICLIPRFTAKAFQKIFMPRDVDIVREEVRQGKWAHLEQYEVQHPRDDDTRPIYPPSVAQTGTTHNPQSQNGSDGTDYTGHRQSIEPPRTSVDAPRMSIDRPRPSFDRMRQSMDKIRQSPSFEASDDFTSAARLTRMESSHSQNAITPTQSRMIHGSSSLR